MEYSVCLRLAISLHLGEYADDNASVSSAAQSGSLGDAEMKKKKTMMQGFENLSSSLANVKFKVVVGLETPADRIARIEKQLAALEDEERSLIEAVNLANENVEQLVGKHRRLYKCISCVRNHFMCDHFII